MFNSSWLSNRPQLVCQRQHRDWYGLQMALLAFNVSLTSELNLRLTGARSHFIHVDKQAGDSNISNTYKCSKTVWKTSQFRNLVKSRFRERCQRHQSVIYLLRRKENHSRFLFSPLNHCSTYFILFSKGTLSYLLIVSCKNLSISGKGETIRMYRAFNLSLPSGYRLRKREREKKKS